MNQSSQPSGWSTLQRHVGAVRRRWPLVLLVAALAVLASLAISIAQPARYQASTDVLLSPTLFDVGRGGTSIEPEEVNTQAQVVTSAAVARLVQADLGLEEPPDLTARIAVDALGATRVLRITATDPRAQDAADLAESVATSYLSYRRTNAQQNLADVQAGLAERQEKVEKRITQIDKELGSSGSGNGQLQAERRNLLSQLGQITSQLANLDITVSRSAGGNVLTEPEVPGSPASPRPVFNAVLALLVGLLLGVAIALFRDRYGSVVTDSSTLRESLGGVPVVSVMPSWRGRGDRSLVTITKPDSRSSQAFHSLAAGLRLRFAGRPGGDRGVVVVCTSAQQGEGKSVVAANLGVAAARSGLQVIVADADLRREGSERIPGIPADALGLSDALAGDEDGSADSYLVDGPIGGLQFLPAGKAPADATSWLASRRVQGLLEKLAGRADLVVVDAPATLNYADAGELATSAELVLLVTRVGSSRRLPVAVSAERLSAATDGFVGGVVIGGDMRAEMEAGELLSRPSGSIRG